MIHCVDAKLHQAELTTRLPFRYGIATMTDVPHVFLSTEWDIYGTKAAGLASEHLPPKWFTKDPDTPVEDEIETMLEVIRKAVTLARDCHPARNVFAWWQQLQSAMSAWAGKNQIPSLLAGLGTSLVERSLLDAYCRHQQKPLHRITRDSSSGLDLGSLHPALKGSNPADWLPSRPLSTVTLRHTVGLGDPLYDADIPRSELLNDGLPQSLESCIDAYGLREFKIKLCGNSEKDESRLAAIFDLLDQSGPREWRFSLDGNEIFITAEEFRNWWSQLTALPWMRKRVKRLLFVEQPVHRDTALTDTANWNTWSEAPPIIIDESGGDPSDLRRALELGYSGISHKNCKGVFHGIANACLLKKYHRDQPERTWIMSGEDLANIGPISLLQDLAVQALLGNTSVERNGHHYFKGLSIWPEKWQYQIACAHPDVYHKTKDGLTTLLIQEGELNLKSLHQAPFGLSPLLLPDEYFRQLSTS